METKQETRTLTEKEKRALDLIKQHKWSELSSIDFSDSPLLQKTINFRSIPLASAVLTQQYNLALRILCANSSPKNIHLCHVVEMPDSIKNDKELAKEGEFYISLDGSYVSRCGNTVHSDTLPKLLVVDAAKLKDEKFKFAMLNTVSKKGHVPPAYSRTKEIISSLLGALLPHITSINEPSKSQNNRTALHLAAMAGSSAAVIALLHAGAYHTILDDFGCAPIHLAYQNGYYNIVEILILIGSIPFPIPGLNLSTQTIIQKAVDLNPSDETIKLAIVNKFRLKSYSKCICPFAEENNRTPYLHLRSHEIIIQLYEVNKIRAMNVNDLIELERTHNVEPTAYKYLIDCITKLLRHNNQNSYFYIKTEDVQLIETLANNVVTIEETLNCQFNFKESLNLKNKIPFDDTHLCFSLESKTPLEEGTLELLASVDRKSFDISGKQTLLLAGNNIAKFLDSLLSARLNQNDAEATHINFLSPSLQGSS